MRTPRSWIHLHPLWISRDPLRLFHAQETVVICVGGCWCRQESVLRVNSVVRVVEIVADDISMDKFVVFDSGTRSDIHLLFTQT